MTAATPIVTIFSILHDGTISAWSGDTDRLVLTIDCAYLAERIDQSFDLFYVELSDLNKIALHPWTIPVGKPAVIKTELADIFRAELEILSADLSDDAVLVSCNQHDPAFDYCGGNLTIACRAVKVFDQNKNELTLDQLKTICKDYWEAWRAK